MLPEHVVAVASAVMRRPPGELAAALSARLRATVAHDALVLLSPECPASPVDLAAGARLRDRLLALEWWRILERAPGRSVDLSAEGLRGRVWNGGGGRSRIALVLLARSGLALDGDREALLQAAAELVAVRMEELDRAAAPSDLAVSQAVGAERDRVARALRDRSAHAMSAVLGAMRAALAADGREREARLRRAIDVASDAVLDLRRSANREASAGAEPLDGAWEAIRSELEALSLPGGPAVEAALEGDARTELPSAVAHAARQITRAALGNVVDHAGARRARVAWRLEDRALVVVVADDGCGFDTHQVSGPGLRGLRERAEALGGALDIDAAPAWGTRVTARLPLLGAPRRADERAARRVTTLGDREREVLVLLALGLRNREIAERLGISPHTVKFHAANILSKLGVRSRLEAVSLAYAAGVVTGCGPRAAARFASGGRRRGPP